MGLNRITNGLMSNQATYFLGNNMSLLSAMQEKLASGQNINKPSDDPVGLTRILDLSNTLRTDDRYSRNIQSAIAEANTTDKVLDNMVELVHRAQELATQASNFTNNQDGRNAIALEIDQLVSQLVQLGNTDIGGKYVFGGLKTDSPPFVRNGDDITYVGTPTTEDWQRKVEISRGIEITVNLNGEEVMGQSVIAGPAPPLPPTFTPESNGLFKTLINLKVSLQTGGDPNQLTEISSRLDELTVDLNTVLGKQAIVGSISNRLELTQGRIEERQSVLTRQYASIQDIDMPGTIADLNQQQNMFEASLNVTGRILQNSLLNYLR